jgi:capsular exopolysaccharide synthesis family protein
LQAATGQIQRGGIDSVSGVLNSPVVADLRRQRAEVLRKQGDAEARYGEKHPESIALAQQLDGLDRQLRDEARRTVEGIRSDSAAASASAGSLRSQISQLRGAQSRESRVGVQADALDREVETRRTVYNQTAQRAQQLAQQRQNTEATAQVVERAEPPLRPSFPNKPLFAVLGLFLGLCAGAAGVMVAESFDVGMRNQEDVARWLRAPFLVSVPRLTRGQRRERGGSTVADYIVTAPASEMAEALRTIRQSIGSADKRLISICSALPGEGKSTVAMSLARVMAMSGDRVVLVDCDLRRGTLAMIAGITPLAGLVDVLTGEASLEAALLDDPLTSLKILPVAQRGFTPRDLFGSDEMTHLLETLQRDYDRVILDTPPILAVNDARTLAQRSDTSIMLVRWNATARFAAQAAVKRLRQDETTILGVVLTMMEKRAGLDRSDPAYYSSAYAEYYRD